MSEMTFIHKEVKSMPGFKVLKNKKTVLLGVTSAGYKLKPFEIWHRESPRSTIATYTLPVHYRSS
jgi:hypothetical protein